VKGEIMPTQDTKCTTPDNVTSWGAALAGGALTAAATAAIIAAALGIPGGVAVGIGVIFAPLGGLAGYCDWYFNTRLVCISDDQAAVAKVHQTTIGFDGDFTLDTLLAPNSPGATLAEIQASAPSGFLMQDMFPGQLPFVPEKAGDLWSGSPIFHIEIEGTRMKGLCTGGMIGGTLGAIAGLIFLAACAAAVGWTIIGLLFCLLVALIVAAVGLALGAGIGRGLASDADPGDAGETRDIAENDCIAFRGREIYDSGHEGWNEIHAVMRIMKLGDECTKLTPDRIKVIISGLAEADAPGTHSEQLRHGNNHFLVHRRIG
jgi:hypothetical protein